MDYLVILEQVFEILVFPTIILMGTYVIQFIHSKIVELKERTKNSTTHKYLDMLDKTVETAVLATTQTYVESLKKQGKFDGEAQKVAFNRTHDAIMKVLTADAIKYLTEAVGDLEAYVTNMIESKVAMNKSV